MRGFRASMAAGWLLLRALRERPSPGLQRLRGPCWGWGPGLFYGAGRKWPYLVHRAPMGVAGAGGRALQVTVVSQRPLRPGREEAAHPHRLFSAHISWVVIFCLSFWRFKIESSKNFTIF